MSSQASSGRIVIYTLNENDAIQINRRRTSSLSISQRINSGAWPIGAQAHIGSHARAGEDYPMVVIRVLPNECGEGKDGINGQVLLDGTDVFWTTSVCEGTTDGTWHWPARV